MQGQSMGGKRTSNPSGAVRATRSRATAFEAERQIPVLLTKWSKEVPFEIDHAQISGVAIHDQFR